MFIDYLIWDDIKYLKEWLWMSYSRRQKPEQMSCSCSYQFLFTCLETFADQYIIIQNSK